MVEGHGCKTCGYYDIITHKCKPWSDTLHIYHCYRWISRNFKKIANYNQTGETKK